MLDACAAMQNLREAIASYRHRLYYAPSDARRASLLHVCLEYLERYFVLISFATYLNGPGFQPGRWVARLGLVGWAPLPCARWGGAGGSAERAARLPHGISSALWAGRQLPCHRIGRIRCW